jgi:hypothetical protein
MAPKLAMQEYCRLPRPRRQHAGCLRTKDAMSAASRHPQSPPRRRAAKSTYPLPHRIEHRAADRVYRRHTGGVGRKRSAPAPPQPGHDTVGVPAMSESHAVYQETHSSFPLAHSRDGQRASCRRRDQNQSSRNDRTGLSVFRRGLAQQVDVQKRTGEPAPDDSDRRAGRGRSPICLSIL